MATSLAQTVQDAYEGWDEVGRFAGVSQQRLPKHLDHGLDVAAQERDERLQTGDPSGIRSILRDVLDALGKS